MTLPPLPQRRRLGLDVPPNASELSQARELDGILALDAEGRHLRITYDLNRASFPALVKQLRSVGLRQRDGIIARLFEAWAGFQDDNRRAQSRIVHQCCNTPPKS